MTNPSPKTRRIVGHLLGWVTPSVILVLAVGYTGYRENEWQKDRASLLAEGERLAAEVAEKRSEIADLAEEGVAIMALLDSRDTMVAILDQDGRVTKWNPAAERYSGRSEEEMKGQTLQSVMTAEGWVRHEPGFIKFMRDPQSKERVQRVACDMVHATKGQAGDTLLLRVQTLGEMDKGTGTFRRALALGDRESHVLDLTRVSR